VLVALIVLLSIIKQRLILWRGCIMPEHNIRNVDEMLSSSVAMLEVLEILVLEGLLIDYVDVETIGTYINHIKNNQIIIAQIIEQCIK
jgi:hypothetical protein